MMIDNRINTNYVKPVAETKPTQIDMDKPSGISFEELLRSTMMQDQQIARRAAETRRNEAREREKEQADTTSNPGVYQHSASIMASYSMMDQLIRAQNRQQKDKEHEQQVNLDADRTL